jgi:hypothetical protein
MGLLLCGLNVAKGHSIPVVILSRPSHLEGRTEESPIATRIRDSSLKLRMTQYCTHSIFMITVEAIFELPLPFLFYIKYSSML